MQCEIEKWQSSKTEKKDKINKEDYIQTICIPSDYGENMCKV